MTPSKRFVTTTGDIVLTTNARASGGQGDIFEAMLQDDRTIGMVKLFKNQFHSESTRSRIRYLVNLKLYESCSVICSPTHMIDSDGYLGHYTPYVPGHLLESILEQGDITLIQALQLSLAVARAIEALHGKQIAHGDLHPENIIVESSDNDVVKPHLIDLDNFSAPGQPLPDMVGQSLYLSPEQRTAIAQNKPALPDIYTDLFELGVLIHEMILLKHPATGADGDEQSFNHAMREGRWIHDPKNGGTLLDNFGGYPAAILGPELSCLFRRSMGLDKFSRPTGSEWIAHLQTALNSVHTCPDCNGPFVFDPTSYKCPYCHKDFPTLLLQTRAGKKVILNRAAVAVGRELLNGDLTVSARHAIFRRRGPLTYIESRGSNGTSIWDGNTWVLLPQHCLVVIKDGDRLRFGDFEVQLKECK